MERVAEPSSGRACGFTHRRSSSPPSAAPAYSLLCRFSSTFPQLHRAVPGRTCETEAVRGKRHAPHAACVTLERAEAAAGFQIPEPDGVVVAGADEDFTVCRDDQGADPASVALQRSLLERLRHFEYFDRLIAAAGDEVLGVRRKGHGPDPIVHRLLESAVVLDEIPARLGRVFLSFLPVPVMQNLLFAAG